MASKDEVVSFLKTIAANRLEEKMRDIVDRLRMWAKTIRRTPQPLSDAIPMVSCAADEIERLRKELKSNANAAEIDFETIEDCFPDGAVMDACGNLTVSAQWLHDFARRVAAMQKGGV